MNYMLMRDFTEFKDVMTSVELPNYKPVLYMDNIDIWDLLCKFRAEKSENYEYEFCTRSWIYLKPVASWMEPNKDRDRTPGDKIICLDLQSMIYDRFKGAILGSHFQEDLAANLERLVRCIHSKVFLQFIVNLLIKYIYDNDGYIDLHSSTMLDNIEKDLSKFNESLTSETA